MFTELLDSITSANFKIKLSYDEIDKASVELRAIFKRRMESKNIIILEDDDLLITQYPVNMNTDFHVDLSQFRFKPCGTHFNEL